jgi:hypothetical protein
MGVMWHFPAFAVTLGASNFRRLLAATPHLARAARRCPAFAGVCMSLPADTAVRRLARVLTARAPSPAAWAGPSQTRIWLLHPRCKPAIAQ